MTDDPGIKREAITRPDSGDEAPGRAVIGKEVPGWTLRPWPDGSARHGRHVSLEPLEPARHAAPLFAAFQPHREDWTYLPYGPFESLAAYTRHLETQLRVEDARHYAVIQRSSGLAVGSLALLRIQPAHGVLEVGSVCFSSLMQRSPLGTEAHFLLMAYVFDVLGYRRYEWKCDRLNARSWKAAERLGFQFEGIFRQAMVYKGRNRDTAWFSITDGEWPDLKHAFQQWLDIGNQDDEGRQHRSLMSFRSTPPENVPGESSPPSSRVDT